MLMRFPRAALALVLTLVAAAAHAAPAPPKPLPPFRLSPGEYFPVSQVRPGMKGYGLTVFKGVKIERFAVEVVGVMPQGDMGRPLVLVMLKGGPITERQANLIQGMSGSPIYINGKLLGAFALGETFGREALGMVRPIEDMVDAFDPRLPERPMFAAAPDAAGVADAPALTLPASAPATVSHGNRLFRPLPLPLLAAGASARTVARLNEGLRPLGVEVMAAPGGAPANQADVPSYFPKNVPLEPGASLAVSLMQGDVDLTAIGVVTYRKGNRILAFGHPFLQLGPAEYPASTAYIHDVFSSTMVSSKYGSPIRTVGTIQYDGPFSVGGLLHRYPRMIPMSVRVNDTLTGRARTFNVRMVNHPLLLPTLILSGAGEVVDRIRPYPGESMADVSFTIVPEGHAPITRSNTVFDAASISSAAMGDIAGALSILSRNPFEPVPIQRVDVKVTLKGGRKTAVVQRAWVEKNKVEPGDILAVQAVIKPYKQPAETRTVRVKVPENAPAGAAQVVVYGGQTGFGTITAAAAPPSGAPITTGSMTVNTNQLIARYLERARNDELGVNLLLPGSVVSVDGERFTGLPDALAAVMKSTKASNTRLERDEVKLTERTPYVLAGSQTLNITIERKSGLGRASEASAPAPSASDGDGDDGGPGVDVPAATDGPASAMGLFGWSRLAVETPAPGSAAKDAAPAAPAKDAADAPKPAQPATPAAKEPETKPADTAKEGAGPGRAAKAWRQSGKAAFEAGRLTNATVSSEGEVRLTETLRRVAETTQPYIWSLLALEDGSALAGTGNSGEVLKVEKDGTTRVFARTGDLQVHALARDGRGGFYAGASPNGRIVRIDGAGAARPFFDTGEKYILALHTDARGNLYAGTGPDGKLFVITPSGVGRELARLPGATVTSLAMEPHGALLAGTAPEGLVFRVTPGGEATAVFDAPENSVTAIAALPSGGMALATAPGGKVYRVTETGRSEVLLEKADDAILALTLRQDGAVLAAGGKTVYVIAPDKTVTTLDNDDQNQIVSLALASDGTVWAGSANTGAIYRTQRGSAGTLLSAVHDAGLKARWGRLEHLADVPDGAQVEIRTRTGNTAQPDATWSDWSAPTVNGAAAPVESPAARYIQYSATLTPGADGASPALQWVSVRYLTENRPPVVKFTDPKDAVRWNGKQTVKWTGSDPDSDVLTYSLFVSSDSDASWKPLSLQPEPEKKPAPEPKEAPEAAAREKQEKKNAETQRRVEAELDKHNALSPEMRAEILESATTVLKGENGAAGKSNAADAASKTSFAWDTTKEKDGVYRLKLVASDKTSNPLDALTAETISGPIMVANAKPSVAVEDKATQVAADKTVTLRGTAKSPSAAILRVSYRVDGGEWLAAAPVDGIFDSPDEQWLVLTDPLESGERTIEIRVNDEVDNAATASVKVTVP